MHIPFNSATPHQVEPQYNVMKFHPQYNSTDKTVCTHTHNTYIRAHTTHTPRTHNNAHMHTRTRTRTYTQPIKHYRSYLKGLVCSISSTIITSHNVFKVEGLRNTYRLAWGE